MDRTPLLDIKPALLKLPEFESAVTVTAPKVAIPATPRVPVLDVFWKKAPAPVFESIPEFDKNEVAPPVKSTLLAIVVT